MPRSLLRGSLLLLILLKISFSSPQKGFVKTAVDCDDLPCGFAQAVSQQEKDRLGLVAGGDRALGQGAIGVELRELGGEAVRRFIVLVGDVVLRE